jgi:hypothetical protein
MKTIHKIEWIQPEHELLCFVCNETAKNEVQVTEGDFVFSFPLCDRCSGLSEWQLIKALETDGKKEVL